MGSSFDLRFLGAVRVLRDGEPVQGFRSRKGLALLAYLAVQGRPVPREQLVALFWEPQPEERGRANLSWVLNRISTLLPGCLQSGAHTVAFERASGYRLDIDAFEQWLARAQPADLAAAVELYRGDFLEGMAVVGCAEFEVWLAGERERWRRRAAQALEALTAYHSQRGEHEAGLRWARRLLALEPWREEAHREVMRLLARCGRRSAALAQYETCRRTLARDLDAEPDEETTALYERLRAAAAAPRHNLPPQPTAFVGREAELAELLAQLDGPDGRLVTVCGPGGIGKTRLALEAAAARSEAFIEGVRCVPLVAVDAPASLASAIADALHISPSGSRDAGAQVVSYLRERELLLLLDGFEHLLARPAAAETTRLLEDILTQAPGVRLLVTSRQRLGLRWERCFELEGLECPQAGAATAAEVQGCSAVRLFVQAAQRVARRFTLTEENALAVAHTCRLVEGMPLAIELAAAAVKTHTCQEIARRIQEDLGFLASPLHDAPARHRSLRAALAHSWRLLTPAEQQAMMGLSRCRQGFTPEAARGVAGAGAAVLESLVDKSLVRFLPSGRYEMHELLRQYAAEALAAVPGGLVAADERHSAFYLALLGARAEALAGPHAATAIAVLRPDMGNVRAAWQWATAQGDLASIARSLDALWRLYLHIGPYGEGDALVAAAADRVRPLCAGNGPLDAAPLLLRLLAARARLLDRSGLYEAAIEAAQEAVGLSSHTCAAGAAGAALTMAHLQWGHALMRLGRHEAAQARLEEALALSRSASRRDLQATALSGLGNVHHSRHDLAAAGDCYRQALTIAAEGGDRSSECTLLANLGLVAQQQGHYAEASARYAQALDACRESGDRWAEALALVNLGYVLHAQGDYAQAQAQYGASLQIAREIGDRQAESIALACLGLLSHHLSDGEAAQRHARQALRIAREIGERRVQAYALTRLGHALLQLERPAEAAEAYRQAAAIRGELRQQDLAVESLAGLARAHLAAGDIAQALATVEGILGQLQSGALLGADEPLRIHLTCYRVLRVAADPRAPAVLAAAHRLLQELAARIDDEALRHSFLHNVAAHRELLEELAAQ